MTQNLKTAVDELAAEIGNTDRSQNEDINKLKPANADSLHNQALSIYNATTTKITGFLSQDAAAVYKSGQGAGTQVTNIINDATFALDTPSPLTGVSFGDSGSLELHINDVLVDSFNLSAAFNAANKDVAQIWTPANSPAGKITITSVECFNKFWQKVNARLSLIPTDLRKGWNKITLKHVGISPEQVSQDFELFNDTATTQPAVTVPTLVVKNKVSKWLSGFEYLGAGSVLKVVAEGTNLFDNTYVGDPLTLSGLSGASEVVIAPVDSAVTGLSNPPQVGQKMTVTDKLVTLDTANQCSADGRITIKPKRPSGIGAAQQSASQNLAINTFVDRSTDTAEYFDEKYREPLTGWSDTSKTDAMTGNWNSQSPLPNGEARAGIVATNQPGLITIGNYKRKFFSNNVPKSSIALTFGGVVGTFGQVGQGDINVEIMLPGQTGWMDAVKPYAGNPPALVNDGAGCMASISGNTLNATFATYSNFGSNYRCRVRVTLRTANARPISIISNW